MHPRIPLPPSAAMAAFQLALARRTRERHDAGVDVSATAARWALSDELRENARLLVSPETMAAASRSQRDRAYLLACSSLLAALRNDDIEMRQLHAAGVALLAEIPGL